MPHPQSDNALEDRRKKLKFRAWRRGFREIDLILGPFADRYLGAMDETGLAAFEALMHAPDQDVYDWIMEAAPAPVEYNNETLALIRAFRFQMSQPK